MADENPYEPPSPESQQADADLAAEKKQPRDTSERLMRLAIGGGGLLLLIPASIVAFCVTCVAVTVGTGMSSMSISIGMAAGVIVVVLLSYFTITNRNRRRKP
jgi:hypothetical protein